MWCAAGDCAAQRTGGVMSTPTTRASTVSGARCRDRRHSPTVDRAAPVNLLTGIRFIRADPVEVGCRARVPDLAAVFGCHRIGVSRPPDLLRVHACILRNVRAPAVRQCRDKRTKLPMRFTRSNDTQRVAVYAAFFVRAGKRPFHRLAPERVDR